MNLKLRFSLGYWLLPDYVEKSTSKYMASVYPVNWISVLAADTSQRAMNMRTNYNLIVWFVKLNRAAI